MRIFEFSASRIVTCLSGPFSWIASGSNTTMFQLVGNTCIGFDVHYIHVSLLGAGWATGREHTKNSWWVWVENWNSIVVTNILDAICSVTRGMPDQALRIRQPNSVLPEQALKYFYLAKTGSWADLNTPLEQTTAPLIANTSDQPANILAGPPPNPSVLPSPLTVHWIITIEWPLKLWCERKKNKQDQILKIGWAVSALAPLQLRRTCL